MNGVPFQSFMRTSAGKDLQDTNAFTDCYRLHVDQIGHLLIHRHSGLFTLVQPHTENNGSK